MSLKSRSMTPPIRIELTKNGQLILLPTIKLRLHDNGNYKNGRNISLNDFSLICLRYTHTHEKQRDALLLNYH